MPCPSILALAKSSLPVPTTTFHASLGEDDTYLLWLHCPSLFGSGISSAFPLALGPPHTPPGSQTARRAQEELSWHGLSPCSLPQTSVSPFTNDKVASSHQDAFGNVRKRCPFLGTDAAPCQGIHLDHRAVAGLQPLWADTLWQHPRRPKDLLSCS